MHGGMHEADVCLVPPGISFKTQLLYSIVFITRYLDIFGEDSFYRFVMKVFFIASSVYVLYLMRIKYR